MLEIKRKFETIVENKINLNLVGPNGSGKTTLTKEILKLNNILHFYIKFSDFIVIDNIYEQFKTFLVTIFTKKDMYDDEVSTEISLHLNNILDKKIKKFSDFYELLDELSLAGDYYENFYIIIDSIEDIGILSAQNKINKYFKNILFLCRDFNFKLILISNFDIKNSEVNSFYDFSDFITLMYPKMNNGEQKQIALDNLNSFSFNNEINLQMDNCLNYALGNYEMSILNKNKLIQNVKSLSENINKDQTILYDQNKRNKEIKNQMTNQLYYDNTQINQSKNNLTEILSFSQKILLVSSFLAGELDSQNDLKLFANIKMTKKKYKLRQFVRSKLCRIVRVFTIHRLSQIYSVLLSIVNDKEMDLSVELISDFNTLFDYNLLRNYHHDFCSKDSFIDLNKNIISNVNFSLAERIAHELGLSLSDFIGNDNFFD